MYDTKWDGQSTHRCSSRHQKQTTGRGHRFESHNSLGSESSPVRCSPFGAFPLLPTECFENLTFHYRPAVWHATIATLVKRSRDTLNAQQGNGREKHWHKHLGTEQVGGVGTLCVIFTAEVYNSSLIELHARRLTTTSDGEEQLVENTS